MTRDELIEAMARAIWDTRGYVHSSEDRMFEPLEYGEEGEYAPAQALCNEAANSALSSLCAAIPGLASLIDGTGVVVPREPTEAIIDTALIAWIRLYPAYPGEKPHPTSGDVATTMYAAMIENRPK